MLHQRDNSNPDVASPSFQVFPPPTGGSSGAIPTGTVLPYAGTAAPSGYVLANGATYDGTNATYTALWNVLGTVYGGTGQSSFKVPDLQGRVVVGVGTNADVSAAGKSDGQTTVANRRPRHAHTVTDPGHGHDSRQFVTTSGGSNGVFTGSGAAHDDLIRTNTTGISVGVTPMVDAPAYLVLNYIIKL